MLNSILNELSGRFAEGLQFESKSRHVRRDTRKTMRKLYLDPNQRHRFMEMELALSADPA